MDEKAELDKDVLEACFTQGIMVCLFFPPKHVFFCACLHLAIAACCPGRLLAGRPPAAKRRRTYARFRGGTFLFTRGRLFLFPVCNRWSGMTTYVHVHACTMIIMFTNQQLSSRDNQCLIDKLDFLAMNEIS
jgi:hypothetical protein